MFTYFNALGETGGLQGILISFSMTVLGILNTNKAGNYLVGRLYSTGSRTEQLNPAKQSALREWIQSFLPLSCLCRCLTKNKRELQLERARDLYARETDIVHILRQLRFLNSLSTLLLPQEQLS